MANAAGRAGIYVGMFAGDSNAGHKRPYQGSPGPWYCLCRPADVTEPEACQQLRLNPGYLRRCPGCEAEAPC